MSAFGCRPVPSTRKTVGQPVDRSAERLALERDAVERRMGSNAQAAIVALFAPTARVAAARRRRLEARTLFRGSS